MKKENKKKKGGTYPASALPGGRSYLKQGTKTFLLIVRSSKETLAADFFIRRLKNLITPNRFYFRGRRREKEDHLFGIMSPRGERNEELSPTGGLFYSFGYQEGQEASLAQKYPIKNPNCKRKRRIELDGYSGDE